VAACHYRFFAARIAASRFGQWNLPCTRTAGRVCWSEAPVLQGRLIFHVVLTFEHFIKNTRNVVLFKFFILGFLQGIN
jgi:hypothetical protein